MRRMPRRTGPRRLLRLLGQRQPTIRGTIGLDGLDDRVVIGRDRWGIPHIDARTDADAWFGLGFCHGQDRAFQLELLARAGRGTLSALLGEATIGIDRLSRTLGFARLANVQVGVVDPDVRESLEAYVRGVNAAAAITPRPHELVLLRAERSTWGATDVLAFLGLQSLALAGNWDTELARLAILLADGPEALARVEPTYGPWLPVMAPVGAEAGPSLARLAGDVAALRDVVGGSGASNAWAVAPSRSRTGGALLANDPHLGPSIPAPWYLAHIRTPTWSVAGASFVGGPAFPSGHNGAVAWGITAACTDSADLFWEEVDEVGGTARGPDGPEGIERIEEPIEVRGGSALVETVVVTPRGPIVTPLLDTASPALALRATWLEPVRVRGLLDVVRAGDVASFRSAFADWPGPALNVVAADRMGSIGWQLIGTLPRRRAGNGTLPRPAWAPDGGWEADHVPHEEMPFLVDPSCGYIASANHAARSDAPDRPFLGADWLDGYRAAAILAALERRDDWDVAATATLQRDVTAVAWPELAPYVLGAEGADADARLASELLRSWDGVMDAPAAAASVFELVVTDLAGRLACEDAPEAWRWAVGAGVGEAMPRTSFGARIVSQVVRRLGEGPDRRQLIGAALGDAVRLLRRRFGPDPGSWSWGRVRPLTLQHPMGVRRPLDRFLNVGPMAIGGDTNTIAQAGVRPLDPLANPAAIANHRMVVDLADPDRSRYALAGGQSGNPCSPHYDDLVAAWHDGPGIPIPWSDAAVDAAVIDRLELVPAGAAP